MRAWLACTILLLVLARVAWVTRDNRQSVQVLALTAATAVVLTLLR